MYLSKLELFGFKSFAQRAVFRFDEDLTAIIGPNGCGKSNIVDAVRWVLGEQRPTVLRCDRMDNLIFSGTATRKPLNMAEVSLYIENNKRILPSEYTEIKITRRLYRSGESEYLINNQQVRLMDIVNLFADTGMGADAYSVIELKMVEQILSDNEDDRRRMFEEAAGIKKYKFRRKSALRKLETTRQELNRLNDLISEVQKMVNSLARQVGKARRYHELKNRLKEKELLLSRLKLCAYESDLQPLEIEYNQIRRSRDSLGKEVHTREAELETQQARAVEMEQAYREVASRLYEQDELTRELQKDRQLRQQRIDSLKESITSHQAEISHQQQKIERLTVEKETLEEQIKETQQLMQSTQQRYRTSANRQQEAETEYQTIQKTYHDFVQNNLQQLHQSNALRETYQKIQIEKENVQAQLERNRETLQKVSAGVKTKENEIQKLQKQLKTLQADRSVYLKEITHLEKGILKLKDRQETLYEEINLILGQLEKIRNQKEFLEKLIENYEGFSESVQYVMSHKSQYRGLVDTLANLVDSEETYRPALESFLAEIANYLIVENVDTARKILESIRRNGKGRLTVIPLPLVYSNNQLSVQNAPPQNGKALPLKQVVTFEKTYAKLFNFLFENVYLVPDIETAIQTFQQYPHLTYVTHRGEILGDWGHITGGNPRSSFSLIGRRKQYQVICQHLNKISKKEEAFKSKLKAIKEQLEQSEKKLNEFQGFLKEVEQLLQTTEGALNQQVYEMARLQETRQDLQGEIHRLEETMGELTKNAHQITPAIKQLEKKMKIYENQEKDLQEEQRKSETQLKQLTEATQKLQVDYLNLFNQEKRLNEKLQFIENSLKEASDYITQHNLAIAQNEAQINTLHQENLSAEKQLETAYQTRDATEREKNKIEKRFQELKSSIQVLENDLKKKHRLWNQARERLQNLELNIKELQVKRSSLLEQLEEKYGAEALKFKEEDLDSAVTVVQVQEEIEALRQKLESLGDVNPLAIKEHEKEKERLDFLKAQRDDLLTAEHQLLETIHKLNRTARKQFLKTYDKIRQNFQRVFGQFFEGGTGDLVLQENQDPLEANIDISVKIKGKKLNTLSLLSAGEKTLTAISLLFSIYLVKPSPFCILDEVDAPLDDVNIGRFTHALKQFSRETQFILVTHNKKTMEATQSLYGITMEEPGVSKVVSVRLD